MLGYFPAVYNNELFYSTIARYHCHSGNTSLSQTTKDLYNKSQIKANVEFASNLNVLTAKLGVFNYISVDEIIEKHTMFPYFSKFVNCSLQEDLKQVLFEGGNLNKLYVQLGLQGHKVKTHPFLKYCRKCLEEDLERPGEGYWRINHQLPSSYICLKHEEILLDSCATFKPKNKTEFVPTTKENCNGKGKNQSLEFIRDNYSIFKAITKKGLEMLASKLSIDYRNLHQIYRNLLGIKGYLTANGAVKQLKLGHDFEGFYGKDILSFLNCGVRSGDNSCWLRLITSKHRSVFHPLYHLLFLHFLNIPVESLNDVNVKDYKPFGEGPYPCLNPAADHYKELIINDVKVNRDQNTGNPRGLFSCECGYQYVRIGPDSKTEDIFRYNKIYEYGPIWKEKLNYLVINQKLTLNEAAEKLHVYVNLKVSHHIN